MLHRILAAVLLTVVYSSTMAQSADRRAGAAMNASDWFRLRKIYRTESHLMSPFLRDMAKALLDDDSKAAEGASEQDGIIQYRVDGLPAGSKREQGRS